MAKPKELKHGDSQNLLRLMSAGAPHEVVEKVIRFTNNDVPAYLENLKRFEIESRKANIVLKG
jgi:hypothetical protein